MIKSQILFAIIKLALIASIGAILQRKKILTSGALSFLTFFLVNLAIPALIFSHLIENFSFQNTFNIGVFLLLSLIIFLAGFTLSFLASIIFRLPLKKEFISLCSFQNSGYLPLNIALFLISSKMQQTFLTYIFLYLLGFNILMWSVATFFIFKKKEEKFKLNSLLTPPVVSTVLAIFFVYLNWRSIPSFIMEPVKMVGNTSFVLSMLVLGAWLSTNSEGTFSIRSNLTLFLATLVKLILVPLVFFVLLLKIKIFSLFGLFIIVQAAMPSAASLPIISDWKKADTKFISQGVLITHIVSILTLPFWINLFVDIAKIKL